MTDPSTYNKLEGGGTGPIIFGRDVSEIPCFRNSWLYGISAGLLGGLATFMGTSRPQLATKYGCVYLLGTTSCYWIYCRYNWMQEAKSAKAIKELIKAQNELDMMPSMSPIRPSSQPDLEIVTVSN